MDRVGSMRTGRRGSAAAMLLTVGLLVSGCALFDPHSQLTLVTLMEDEGYDIDVTTNPVEITDDACDGPLDCVEAYSTDEANYYRFASRDQASDYAASLGDGFVIHYIVMNFAGKDDATKEHQQWAMERLAATWQDYDGTFPER